MNKPAILGGKAAFEPGLPFLRPYLPSYNEMEKELKEIIFSGMLTKGKLLKDYEEKLSHYLSVPHAVGVSSCTMGLLFAIKCLDLKGEVILPSFTFFSTAHAVMWNNLTPLFVDCDPETFNISPSEVRKAITEETSAIIGVHIFGNPADVYELEEIAKEYNLKLIFDSAHGFGSLIDGKRLGSFGDAEVFSTSPTKLLVTGEGGVVTTGNEELSQKIRIGIEYGNPGDYDSIFAGLNARLAEFNSLLGIKSLNILEENAVLRNKLAELYKNELSSVPGISFQKIKEGNRSSYKDFAILIGPDFRLSRDLVWKALESEGIYTKRYFYPPIHRQKCMSYMNCTDKGLENTVKVSEEVLCLPLYASMEEDAVKKVAGVIKNLYNFRDEILNKKI